MTPKLSKNDLETIINRLKQEINEEKNLDICILDSDGHRQHLKSKEFSSRLNELWEKICYFKFGDNIISAKNILRKLNEVDDLNKLFLTEQSNNQQKKEKKIEDLKLIDRFIESFKENEWIEASNQVNLEEKIKKKILIIKL